MQAPDPNTYWCKNNTDPIKILSSLSKYTKQKATMHYSK